ncbi:putative phage tail protein [Bradyrhizobium sp. S3.7.6]
MPEKWVQRTSVEYAEGWNDLLPTGPAWPREPGSVLQSVISGLAQIWGDQTEAKAALLLSVESDPRSTNLLLPDFERAWGLPDNCLPNNPSDAATRRVNLVDKMTFIGAQSRQFFIDRATKYGQTVNVREYSPYQCGISGVGDTTNIDPDGLGSFRWGLGDVTIRFYWTVTVTGLTASWNGSDLYCLMNRWKPAQTVVVFDYSALAELRGSRPWNSGYLALF